MTPDKSAIRVALWTAVIGILNCVQMALFFGYSQPHGTVLVLLIVLFVVAPLGSFWMILDCFRAGHLNRGWQTWMWLIFIPWSFLWYAFEKHEPAGSDLARFRR